MIIEFDNDNKIIIARVEIPLTNDEINDIIRQYPLSDGWTFKEISYGQTYMSLGELK